MSCADNTGTDSFYNDEVGDAWDHRTNFPTKPIKVHNPIFNFYSKQNETTANPLFPVPAASPKTGFSQRYSSVKSYSRQQRWR